MANLYLVTTPIGNSGDLSFRAKQCLEETTVIYCEDTRVFKELCKRVEINYQNKQIYSFHDHSNEKQLNNIIEQAKEKNIAFVSDAGSPAISDPAYPLIRAAIASDGVQLKTLGGVSSVIVALELSGLPTTPFHFHGFLGRDKGRINADCDLVAAQYGTHIFFEGKSRVLSTLEIFANRFPDYNFALARELTKEFESVHRFMGSNYKYIKEQIVEKGEFVFLVHNPHKNSQNQNSLELQDLAKLLLDKGAKPKPLSKLLAKILNLNAKEVYEILNSTRQ